MTVSPGEKCCVSSVDHSQMWMEVVADMAKESANYHVAQQVKMNDVTDHHMTSRDAVADEYQYVLTILNETIRASTDL